MPGKLIVSRKSPRDVAFRRISIFLDGALQEHLYFGRALEVSLEPGTYRLRADNTISKKEIDIEIREGETTEYETRQVATLFGAVMVLILGAGPMRVELNPVQAPDGSNS